MTSKGTDQFDEEFEAFLQGRDALSRHLQSLPQPAPSAELDAAILARAEAELARDAANDPAMPGVTDHARPGFLKRWRTPLAMAASVLFAFLLLLRWQTPSEDPAPLVVAQAPQPAATEPEVPSLATNPPAAPAGARAGVNVTAKEKPLEAKTAKQPRAETLQADPQIAASPDTNSDAATPPIQIAQADPQETLPFVPAPAAAPTTAPVTALPPTALMRAPAPAAMPSPPAAATSVAPATPPNSSSPEKAKAWVALIEELLKADLRQDALAEWEKFRKAYPQYPVPGKLEARIKALQKQPG